MNNSPSHICEILILLERYHQNCQAVFAATGMNGLILNKYNKITSDSHVMYGSRGNRKESLPAISAVTSK